MSWRSSKKIGQEPVAPKAPWMMFVDQEMGQAEIPGSEDNPRIVQYHKETSLKASNDETAWCSSFANWVFKQVGIKGTNSAAALSWLKWGVAVDKPQYGDIVVFDHGNGHGHVTFFDHWKDNLLGCKGGNQSNRVKLSYYGKGELAGFRRPS